ncbi:hypothetical protein LEP1GSC170_2663 [Leptospira interrogans serovar Bataviae str. HAI135]|nr:hypothetical protein LEP1GSC170_2663 [Leptospira interrogans serovar Bataviae str. HAI135]
MISDQNSEKKEILLKLISEFQIDLQKNLESAIRTNAIDVCRTIFPQNEIPRSYYKKSFRKT